MKKLHRVRTFKNDPAEIISVSIAVLGRMRREVIFTRQRIAIIIHFSLETEKKIIRTTDTYLCLSVSSLWTNLASSRMCDWNRNSLPLFGGRSKLYHPCSNGTMNQKWPLTRHVYKIASSTVMFAIKDTLRVQCESALQMHGANKTASSAEYYFFRHSCV